VIQDGGVIPLTGGSLTKTGTGAFTLTGANTYTGGTTVNGGSLFVNNTTGSGTGTGNVTVTAIGAAIGTLGGNGTISGLVTVNGGATLAPGPTGDGSTGILNTGDFTLASGSNFSVDLEGPVAGTDYDQVFVFGAVSILDANLALNLVSGLNVGDQLFIVESTGAVTGTFAGLPNSGDMFTQDGVTFMIEYYPSGVALGGNVELSVVSTAVPEPTTWIGGALAIPFIDFVYIQRRRRAQMLRPA
jgi:autotransporter-associated beta strand protein